VIKLLSAIKCPIFWVRK